MDTSSARMYFYDNVRRVMEMDSPENSGMLSDFIRNAERTLPPEMIRSLIEAAERSGGDAKASREGVERCMICSTKNDEVGGLITLRCDHRWCKDCLETTFSLSLKDETTYPPRCCWYNIPFKEVQKHLPPSLSREFQSRQLEMQTKNKTYCHKPDCSVFIAPHSIHNGEAICQKCSARTCANCRCSAHFGPCSEGEEAAFMEFAKSKSWKRCPTCRRMVEKEDGCSHMECRCGSEFCYGCGCKFNDCSCPIEYDDELLRPDLDGDGTDGGSNEAEHDRLARVENHRDSGHRVFRVVSEKGEQFPCDLCDRMFSNWINRCDLCELNVCNWCRGGRRR